jgi:hypothetical protein
MKKVILLLVSFLIAFESCTKTDKAPDKIVEIKVSKNGYEPDVIHLKQGQVVLFKITALDEGIGNDYSQKYYGHCFYILPPYDVMVENIKEGQIKEVKVKMIYPGKFLFTCPYCSGIFPTKGEIIVEK